MVNGDNKLLWKVVVSIYKTIQSVLAHRRDPTNAGHYYQESPSHSTVLFTEMGDLQVTAKPTSSSKTPQQGENVQLCTIDSIFCKNESCCKYANWHTKPDNPSIQAVFYPQTEIRKCSVKKPIASSSGYLSFLLPKPTLSPPCINTPLISAMSVVSQFFNSFTLYSK